MNFENATKAIEIPVLLRWCYKNKSLLKDNGNNKNINLIHLMELIKNLCKINRSKHSYPIRMPTSPFVDHECKTMTYVIFRKR